MWIIKRLVWIAVLSALVYFGLNYKLDGKPVKGYVSEFYRSPLVQAAAVTGKELVLEFLNDKMGDGKKEQSPQLESLPPPTDHLSEQDQQELEAIIKNQIP